MYVKSSKPRFSVLPPCLTPHFRWPGPWYKIGTVVPGYSVLGFSVLPGFRALKAGDGAWSVHKTLFGFRAPLSQLFI